MVRAVLFDVGGVLTTSPFEAFARFERERGLPAGLLRRINATHPDRNAWAQLERGAIDLETFDRLFLEESTAAGAPVRGAEVLPLLAGDLRPRMLGAVRRCRERYKTACLTNNFTRADTDPRAGGRTLMDAVRGLFDVVLESSVLGVRKPDPRFYAQALERLDVPPQACVFLDDLGVNLKPARALGMRTIKVVSEEQALLELESALAMPLREGTASA
jgi:putative hydrolase of the HAD superfamily